MSHDRPPRKSYAEAMSEWAATSEGRGSFQDRTRISLLSPDPFASPLARVLGYAWRLGLVAVVGAIVYWALMRSHLGGQDFARQMSEQVRIYLRAESVEIPKVSWRGETATIRRLTAEGGTGSFFRQLEANDVTFKVPTAMLWSRQWEVRRVSAGALSIELRSGGLGMPVATGPATPGDGEIPDEFAAPPLPPAAPDLSLGSESAPPPVKPAGKPGDRRALDLRLMKDGFGVAPDFDRLRIDEIDATRLQVAWGTTESARGEFRDASFSAAREADGSWIVQAPEGTLSQNWLRGLHVKDLRARFTGTHFEIEEAAVRLGAATGSLRGRVVLGDVPTLDLTLDLADLPLQSLIGDPFDRVLTLTVAGPLALGGSTNRSTGVTIGGDLTVKGGSLHGLPILEALAEATGRVRFREIEITGGKFTMATGAGRLDVSGFDLMSRDDVVLRGNIRWERGIFSGSLRIGISPSLLEKVSAPVRSEFFADESAGRAWLAVPLQGPFEQLTRETAQSLSAAHTRAGTR